MKRWIVASALSATLVVVACHGDLAGPAATGSIALRIVTGGEPGVTTSVTDGRIRRSTTAGSSAAGPLDHLQSVRVRVSGPSNKTQTLTQTDTSFSGTITGLLPGSYTVLLEGLVNNEVDHFGQRSGVSVVADRNTETTISFNSFRPVLNPLSSPTSALEFDVSWSAVAGSQGYVVEWSTNRGFSNAQSRSVTATSTDVTVTEAGWHHVRVRAQNSAIATGRPSEPDSIEVVPVTPPDLVLTAMTAPTAGTIGDPVTIAARTENQGGEDAGAFEVGIYLSANDLISTADRRIGSCSPQSLAVGGVHNCAGNVTIPSDVTPGTYWLGAIADDQDAVVEGNEGNNSRAAANSTDLSAAGETGPDLVVTMMTAPTTGTVGSPVTISATTENQGDQAAGTFFIAIYLSTNNTITTSDRRLGSCSLDSLAVGGTFDCAGDLTIPVDVTPGTYWLGAIADDQDQVAESDEGNNSLAAANSTDLSATGGTGPDLVVTAMTAPATATIGTSFTIAATTENQGDQVAGAFDVGIYLSTDNVITTDDVFLDLCEVPSLAGGGVHNCDLDVTIESGVTPGTYWLGAIADDLNDVAEANEGNNSRAAANSTDVSAATGPDLVVTAMTAPATGTIGSSVAIAATVENQGNQVTGAFELGIYLSTNDVITTSDRRIAFCQITSLAVGESTNCSGDVTIPSDVTPGTYWLGAFADDLEVVVEANEGNNGLAAANSTSLSQ